MFLLLLTGGLHLNSTYCKYPAQRDFIILERWYLDTNLNQMDELTWENLEPLLQAMKIISCSDANLSNIHFINSSQAHILLMGCLRTEIKNLVITAPESSPNTDGIHIHSSHNVIIRNTTIGTGILLNDFLEHQFY